ncbi:bile acid:sodium symporter [Prevotella sp. tf2-5]|uniref:bile acid:sodium symporter n=1 Tax=Prevotella sp. tf2-5 TaxID=1761889 RepID=UPI0008EE230B|nr:bile acid:sodium symporter [Prevotella sp. tf2-5]SFO98793.1 bile acid:Na+ symporter, BASS family [Prevotella sp. tf2-5]
MGIIRFLKDWTLPVAIATGTVCYLTFYYVPQLDELGNTLSPIIDTVFPISVFLTLLVTFCKVNFHEMRPHRWHTGILMAQLLLVAVIVGICLSLRDCPDSKLVWEAILTCVIGPSAAAAPVVVGKLGGNISTMTTYTLLSSFFSALMIPLVFPILEQMVHVAFFDAFLIILEKVSMVLLLPLVLGWLMQHYVKGICARIAAMPNLSFYCWAFSLSITSGITVKNIVHSNASLLLLMIIALSTFILCWVQFFIGRGIGKRLGEEINCGQALFQKNTALSIWVAYMYLHPVASIGAGCYVLWQNIINSFELWQYRQKSK